MQYDWCPFKKVNEGRKCLHLLQAKEHQRLPRHFQKLGDRHGADSPLHLSEGTNHVTP